MSKQTKADGRPIDEIKHKKEMEKGLKKLVKDGTRILKLVQMHPDTWAMEELAALR